MSPDRYIYIPKGETTLSEPISTQVNQFFIWIEGKKDFATIEEQDGTTVWRGQTDKGLSFSRVTNPQTDELTIAGDSIGGQLKICRSLKFGKIETTSITVPDGTYVQFETNLFGTSADLLRLSQVLDLKSLLRSLLA